MYLNDEPSENGSLDPSPPLFSMLKQTPSPSFVSSSNVDMNNTNPVHHILTNEYTSHKEKHNEDVWYMDSTDNKESTLDAERLLHTQSYLKLHKVHHQLGFREGKMKGHQDAAQQSFDQGYKDGYQLGREKGELVGRIRLAYLFHTSSLSSSSSSQLESDRLRLNECIHSILTNDRPFNDIQKEVTSIISSWSTHAHDNISPLNLPSR